MGVGIVDEEGIVKGVAGVMLSLSNGPSTIAGAGGMLSLRGRSILGLLTLLGGGSLWGSSLTQTFSLVESMVSSSSASNSFSSSARSSLSSSATKTSEQGGISRKESFTAK